MQSGEPLSLDSVEPVLSNAEGLHSGYGISSPFIMNRFLMPHRQPHLANHEKVFRVRQDHVMITRCVRKSIVRTFVRKSLVPISTSCAFVATAYTILRSPSKMISPK